jgi:phosphohistidine phosphatase
VDRLAQFLAQKNAFRPVHMWRSPYHRAEETAERLLKGGGLSDLPTRIVDSMTPDRDPMAILGELDAVEGDLLLVGHNPHLSILGALLLSGERSRVRFQLETCSMLCLEWLPTPNFGQLGPCTLEWMMTPGMLADI